MLIIFSKLQFRSMSSVFIQALFILFSFKITLFSLGYIDIQLNGRCLHMCMRKLKCASASKKKYIIIVYLFLVWKIIIFFVQENRRSALQFPKIVRSCLSIKSHSSSYNQPADQKSKNSRNSHRTVKIWGEKLCFTCLKYI